MIDYIKDNTWDILLFINYVLSIGAAILVLLKNVNPTKTLTYIIVLLVFPFVGLIVYYFFGQEYRKVKIFNRKDVLNQKIIKDVQEELKLAPAEIRIIRNQLDEKVKLVRLLSKSEKSPLTMKNELELLKNGEEKFPRLFEDLKTAKDHIHVEYYILEDDKIGTQFIDLLCEMAKSGVEVRLSYDYVGSSISSRAKRKMKIAGIQFMPFMPVLFSGLTGQMNYRNHRKIVIIDGKIGYVGGINVSDKYVNNGESDVYWRDTHLRIEGEAVKELQINFFNNWNFVTDSTLKITPNYFPPNSIETELPVQIAASGPDSDWANIMEAIFTSINTADEYVYITTPYFIPNEQIVTALQVASRSGVDVRLVIPKNSDSWVAKYATNSFLDRLLEANVKIYRYCKGFIHAKTIVVDDMFSTVGTSNMDNRSFNINFEINALIYNRDFTLKLKQQFFDDVEECELLDKEEWFNRPKIDKLKESYSRLWAPLL
ncbi:cardiolipin synthase [Aegicerativicinus sediminis]